MEFKKERKASPPALPHREGAHFVVTMRMGVVDGLSEK